MLINDFTFNGIKLSEMGGILTSDNDEIYSLRIPRQNVTHKVPFVDGELFIKSVVEPLEFRVEVFFEDIETLLPIREWLNVDEPKLFCFDNDICGIGEIECIVDDISDIAVYENEYDTMSVIFGIKFISYNPTGNVSLKDKRSKLDNMQLDNKELS